MESLANAIHAVQAVAAQIEVKEQAATTTAAAAASSGSDRPPPPPPGGPAAADAVADGAPVQQRSMRKRSLPPSAEGGGCGGSKGSSRNFAAKRPKTGYRGVQKKSTNCFQAKIQAGKEGLKALGSFATAEQAAAAYDDELVRLGEARTNFATAELASVAAAAAVAKSGAELDDKVRWKKKKGTGKDSNEKELVRMRTAQKKCPKCERMWGNSKRNCACGHAFVPKASLGSAGVYYSGVVRGALLPARCSAPALPGMAPRTLLPLLLLTSVLGAGAQILWQDEDRRQRHARVLGVAGARVVGGGAEDEAPGLVPVAGARCQAGG